MIPRSTTLTTQGREISSRLLWAGAAAVIIVGLLFAAVLFDRSTVVDGDSGSSFVTTATGVAALFDTLDRAGRDPIRLQRPLVPGVLAGADAFFVADVGLTGYQEVELDVLRRFVTRGGRVVSVGRPSDDLVGAFEVEVDWRGTTTGATPTNDGLVLQLSRFGSFAPGHDGVVDAASDDGDAVIRFSRGDGEIVLVADSSLAHNATIDDGDNVFFLGRLLDGVVVFDEFRHGYDDTPDTGLITAAPGNWPGALAVGAVALIVTLVVYGRRFGPVEPAERPLAPGRGAFIESVARTMRRTGSAIPTDELRLALTRELGLAPDADDEAIESRLRGLGVEIDEDRTDDRVLAAVLARKGAP